MASGGKAFGAATLVFGAAILVAGCGSSDKGDGTTAGGTTNASVTDSHAAQRINNPRQVGVAAYTGSVTDPAYGNMLPRTMSRERSLPDAVIGCRSRCTCSSDD